jgi:hypothetical protein
VRSGVLFHNAGVRHLGIGREILRCRPFLDKGCVRPRCSNEDFFEWGLGLDLGGRIWVATLSNYSLFNAGFGLRSRNVYPGKFRQILYVLVGE